MPRTPPRRARRRAPTSTRLKAALGLVGVILVVTGGIWLARLGNSTSARNGDGATPIGIDDGRLGTATLFYIAEDGASLVSIEREVPFGEDTVARARLVVEALLEAPPPPLVSAFPVDTALRAVYLTDEGDAFVDLSANASEAHPGGSLDELFTVYALVNSLTTSLPEISAVQILIEGQEVDTLAGHVDLRRPLPRNMQWVTAPEQAGDDDAPAEN